MTNFDDFLAEVHTVAIGGHIRPDGDCVGSCLATYNYIKTWYPDIDVTVYLEPIPNIFKFMARSNEIVSDFSGDTVYDLFIAQFIDKLRRGTCLRENVVVLCKALVADVVIHTDGMLRLLKEMRRTAQTSRIPAVLRDKQIVYRIPTLM